MDKVKSRALKETVVVKSKVQSTIALVKTLYQGQGLLTETLNNEAESLKIGMIDAARLEKWLEDMDSALTPVLELLGERMKNMDSNADTGGGGVGIWMS